METVRVKMTELEYLHDQIRFLKLQIVRSDEHHICDWSEDCNPLKVARINHYMNVIADALADFESINGVKLSRTIEEYREVFRGVMMNEVNILDALPYHFGNDVIPFVTERMNGNPFRFDFDT